MKLFLSITTVLLFLSFSAPVLSAPPPVKEEQLIRLDCDGGKHRGTAVRVSARLIVTASHVARSKACLVGPAKDRTATVVYRSFELDFAMLELVDNDAVPYRVSCQEVQYAQSYRAYGYARGTFTEVELIGSGTRMGMGPWAPALFFGTKQVIPGMSGGPIFNSDGDLVAIVTNYDREGNSYGRMMRDTNICSG